MEAHVFTFVYKKQRACDAGQISQQVNERVASSSNNSVTPAQIGPVQTVVIAVIGDCRPAAQSAGPAATSVLSVHSVGGHCR